jgi:opacity protein-like surface antigen
MKKSCLILMVFACALYGADPTVRAGTVEITGFGGVNANFTGVSGQLSTQILGATPTGGASQQSSPALGGGFGIAESRHVMLVAEFQYSSLAPALFADGALSMQEKTRMYELMAGAQYLFRLENSRAVPFIGGGMGVAYFPTKLTLTADGVPSSVNESLTKAAGNLDAGVRLHIAGSFGIRPEFRVMRIPGKTYIRAEAGVFYQFRK